MRKFNSFRSSFCIVLCVVARTPWLVWRLPQWHKLHINHTPMHYVNLIISTFILLHCISVVCAVREYRVRESRIQPFEAILPGMRNTRMYISWAPIGFTLCFNASYFIHRCQSYFDSALCICIYLRRAQLQATNSLYYSLSSCASAANGGYTMATSSRQRSAMRCDWRKRNEENTSIQIYLPRIEMKRNSTMSTQYAQLWAEH